MLHQVILGNGSNLGDREENLRLAMAEIQKFATITAHSAIYETNPWGFTDQPAFLNQVLVVETQLDPFDLLDALKRTEKRIGRTPTFRYGPRVIDIDILFFDQLVLEDEKLIIPHPKIAERAFVLIPLDELVPQFIHPVLHRSIHKMLSEVNQDGVRLYKKVEQTE
ncbi:MAG: 2-amino-4-hydroxy-6-hydroxymethyldihydropteridine diphosphokinase [Chloroflexi bacterium]|jgi:2-amino-4-hydroxy-6-hydroxymethyldihydropteridine diphosphokinase|nr:2-amino-4-hydroxy-6-hydroxymethyldihydropteridine diphosphokinase [Chloroflexota bacterium]